MTDLSALIAFAEASLLDVAKQASDLAIGLQNAAPADKANVPNKSIQYLFEMAGCFNELSGKCKKLVIHKDNEQGGKLLELVCEAVACDKNVREKYQVGEKFRFIRDRVNAVLMHIDETLNAMKKEIVKKVKTISEDEVVVYVYLFNAKGLVVQAWRNMLIPSVFYEHSVNRPVYTNRGHVESFVSRKANKAQHGYLSVVIKKQDIIQPDEAELLKDSYDNPLVRVREGSLQFSKLVAFTHNGFDYQVGEEGELIRKLKE